MIDNLPSAAVRSDRTQGWHQYLCICPRESGALRRSEWTDHPPRCIPTSRRSRGCASSYSGSRSYPGRWGCDRIGSGRTVRRARRYTLGNPRRWANGSAS
jgi:hypothetical protein